jgi:putative transcriptional regulator
MKKGNPVRALSPDSEAANPALPGGPRHHFGEHLVLERTVGAATPGADLAVCCHLALCAPCRALAADLERIGDSLIQGEGTPRPQGELRARILDGAGSRPQLAARERHLPASLASTLPPVPAVLAGALAALPRPRWRWLAPGLRGITLHESEGSVARLLELRPGVVIPIHDHGGDEHTVLFAGGLDDDRVQLARGDALTMAPGEHHRQVAAAGETCIALIVNEAPPRPLTLAGRILKRIARL